MAFHPEALLKYYNDGSLSLGWLIFIIIAIFVFAIVVAHFRDVFIRYLKYKIKNGITNLKLKNTTEKQSKQQTKRLDSEVSSIPEHMQYCIYCGAKIPDGSQYCMKCGKELPHNR